MCMYRFPFCIARGRDLYIYIIYVLSVFYKPKLDILFHHSTYRREFMKHLNKSSQSGDTAGPSLKTVNHPPPLKRSTVPATQSPDSTIIQTQKRQSLASPVNVSEVADILSCSSTQSDQTVVRPYTRKRKTY